MDSILLVPIALPAALGLVCLVIPKGVKWLSELLTLACTAITLGIAGFIFPQVDLRFSIFWLSLAPNLNIQFDLVAGHFGSLILLAVSTFALLISIYSLKYMVAHPRRNEFYAYFLLTLGISAGTPLLNNLLVFLFFWDMLAILLYALVTLGGKDSIPGANKSLIIIGMADLAMLLGIAFLWKASGTLIMSELAAAPQTLSGWLPIAAYLLILVGALAKAGAIPLHSWIPAISETAPIPTMAYLPASLDKLLGIYLLARISLYWFVMTPGVGMVLMIIGAITIVAAVMTALIQNDYRRMLAFHAVSQVGYMVLGIGTGTPVGVIGGLFHMLNHSIYKSCLFLCAGSVQRQTGRTKFTELGGLATAMPWTVVTCLIAALAISGVPPFSGFASKWLIYQGVLDWGGSLFPLFILTAMFGSALTLASFMKLLYSIFWGDLPRDLRKVSEINISTRVPMIFLAVLCVVFGIFYSWPVNTFIQPVLNDAGMAAEIPGIWQAGLATVLLLLSLAIGLIFYLGGRAGNAVETDVFLGGEVLNAEICRVPGTQFYGPIKGLNGLQQLYGQSERGKFDLFHWVTAMFTWAAQWVYRYIDQTLNDFYREVFPSLLALAGQIMRILNSRLILTYLIWAAYATGIVSLIWQPAMALLSLLRIVAAFGMIGWGLLALVETDLRRFLLFAITSQFGFVLLGATLSWNLALIHFVSSGLAFAVLFPCCNTIRRKMKTSEIEALGGLSRIMPGQAIVFLLAALWLAGLPPFGNFFSKYLLGVTAHDMGTSVSLLLAATAVLTLGYFLRPLRIFLRGEG